MKSTLIGIGLFIAGVVGGVLITSSLQNQGQTVGGVYNQVNNYFKQGLTAGATSGFTVNASGKTVTVGTSNTATSTLSVGCIQFYATSTATVQRFQASTTPGIMYSSYGACPNL